MSKNYYSHTAAIVESNNIGNDTRIWAFTHVLPGAVIGKDCNICDHCFIENDVIVGDCVTIKSGVYLWDSIVIEDYVFIGPSVVFTNDARPRSKKYLKKYPKIIIKKSASVGGNSTILPGIEIDEYAMVGAGSVITKNIPNNTLWYGNPAKFKSYICNCGEKLSKELKCNKCSKQYDIKKNKIISKNESSI